MGEHMGVIVSLSPAMRRSRAGNAGEAGGLRMDGRTRLTRSSMSRSREFTKSSAPALKASAAVSTEPYPLKTMTGVSERERMRRSSSSPAQRGMAMSVTTGRPSVCFAK